MTRKGFELREWQKNALQVWRANDHRGIVGAVTGGGKTVFALAAIGQAKAQTSLVVVPTQALLDQWWEETSTYFDLPLDEIRIVTGKNKLRSGTINIAVLNTAAKLEPRSKSLMLVVDECHKAASEAYRKVLTWDTIASLGLSATPDRPYDDGLEEFLVPGLGPVIFQYSYEDALRDGVIVEFELRNVVFDLEKDEEKEYQKLTRAIARTIQSEGIESEKSVALLLKRSRVLNMSLERIRHAVRIAAQNSGKRIIIFHESIDACRLIHTILSENGMSAGIYHSNMPVRERAEMLKAFRGGTIEMLVTCRALDEGFNVPETEIGIIAASTATRRQRIQRLGRILRPSAGKDRAVIYSLAATAPEIQRLREEESELEGVAEVSWSRA